MDFLNPKIKVIARSVFCDKAICENGLNVVEEFSASIKKIVVYNDIRKFKVH